MIGWILAAVMGLSISGGAAFLAASGTPPGWPFGFNRPWWLLLFGLLPILFFGSYTMLAGFGGVRKLLILLLRSSLIACLILTLAELSTIREEEGLTVFLAVDQSYSIPQSLNNKGQDIRWEQLVKNLQEAIRNGKKNKPLDKVGVVSFGLRPRLEFTASDSPDLNLRGIGSGLDKNLTDIGAAIRMSLASFPEGAARRIILISDGNENRGDAEAEARIAKLNGVPIDVVPLRYEYDEEILVDRVDAPTEVRADQDVPLRLVLRNYSGKKVTGTLRITRQAGNGNRLSEQTFTLEPGLNVISTTWKDKSPAAGVVTYKASFRPDRLPGDRPENNEAWAPVTVNRQGRKVLVVTQTLNKGDHEPLVQALGKAIPGQKAREIVVWKPDQIPTESDARRFELSDFDSIVIYNVPADEINHKQQEAIRKSVRDMGSGLVVIGGTDSFGAGRWQGEPLEEAMPVDNSLRSRKIQAKGGLALIMHASEMADGNFWQKEIAKLAINKLGDQDEVGILYYSYEGGENGGHKWHVPLQEIEGNRNKILQALGSMQPGDMPEFDPTMKLALASLTEKKRGIGSKHVILISDGDHGLLNDVKLLDEYKKQRVTLTTIGITTHGPAAQAALAKVSIPTGGRHYAVDDPNQLPSIYIKETRVLNQNYLYEKEFVPQLTSESGDPLREWKLPFPVLSGFVRTSRKESNLVQVLMRAPISGEDDSPILAQWQYGLGRSVAFTSDAGGEKESWARRWVNDKPELYGDFWRRIVEWSMRNLEESKYSISGRYENGKVRVTLIDNREREDRAKKPLHGLQVTMASSGSKESTSLPLEPVSAGVYETVIDAAVAGSYSLTVSRSAAEATQNQNQTAIMGISAISIPYSPEYATVKDNAGLLTEIARSTGGRVIEEKDLESTDLFLHTGSVSRLLQPLWHWLLLASAIILFFDIALRRISLNPMAGVRATRAYMAKKKEERKLSTTSEDYLKRLKSGKAAAGVVTSDRDTTDEPIITTQRFDPTSVTESLETKSPESVFKPKEPKPVSQEKPKETADDYAARLMKARQKAREQMDQQKDE